MLTLRFLWPDRVRLEISDDGAGFEVPDALLPWVENGTIILTTCGRSSGFCVDPIEKKPLNHFLPGTPVLSFGTAGCNLACKFCQNWDMTTSRDMDRLMDQASPETIARAVTR